MAVHCVSTKRRTSREAAADARAGAAFAAMAATTVIRAIAAAPAGAAGNQAARHPLKRESRPGGLRALLSAGAARAGVLLECGAGRPGPDPGPCSGLRSPGVVGGAAAAGRGVARQLP